MKRLFVLAMLLFSFTLTPVSSSAVSTSAAIPIPAASPSNPQRIYGTNVASEVYALTSRTTYEGFIETLTENGSRYVMSDARLIGNNGDAREWIVDQLTTLSAGRMEIELVGSYLSIVARLPGYLPGEHPGFVVSAHYDSPNGSPGANDDGSGIGVLLELARVMSYYEWPLDIYFCAFNGANSLNPLSGSKQVSLEAFNEGMEFLAMYNLDTLLYQNRFADLDKRILLGYSSDADYHVGHYWADLAKMAGSFYGYDIISPIPHGSLPIWQSSDHYPFYQKGYQNVLCAYESGYMYDGVSGTLADQIGYRYFAVYLGREVAGILAATMALTMSRAYGERIHLYPKGTINGGSSRTFHITITTPTTLNITCRWFGGGVSFRLYTPDGTLYASRIYSGASAWAPSQALLTNLIDVGLYRLEIDNLNDAAVGYEAEIVYDSDVDSNGVLDHEEYWLNTALFQSDSDSDSLSDAMEIILGTNGNVPDSDSDSMPDGWEYENGFDPTDASDGLADDDSDGLTNAQEYNIGLDPHSPDSDNDSLPDLWEVENGLNPLLADAGLDPDGDGKTNFQEFEAGTDPNVAEIEPLDLTWAVLPAAAIGLVVIFSYIYRKYS